jgi:hypothetical protein
MTTNIQYIDGIGAVRVANGMAYIDLVVVAPAAADGQPAQAKTVQQLVMALPQFVRLCSEMSGHLVRMEEKGLIKRKAP